VRNCVLTQREQREKKINTLTLFDCLEFCASLVRSERLLTLIQLDLQSTVSLTYGSPLPLF
jgi:hypothetical protein